MKIKYNISNTLRITLLIVLALLAGQTGALAKEFIVNNTEDSGEGTLRQAILDANTHYGPDKIVFNIPMMDSGFLPSELTNQSGKAFFIRLVSPLPKITEVLIIDGKSQTKFTGNTNPTDVGQQGAEIILLFHDSELPVEAGHHDGIYLENFSQLASESVTAGEHTVILAATVLIQDVEMVVFKSSKQSLTPAQQGILSQQE